jgi:two-component sensor histidine kinase
MVEAISALQLDVYSPGQNPNGVLAGESLLLQELNHRMMNTLTIISLSINREITRVDTAHGHLLRQHVERIGAHAEIYRCLCLRGSNDGNKIDVNAYLDRLCRCLAKAILEPLGVECAVVLESDLIAPVQCERLGMIVTELVVNAAKHAFSGLQGQVRISLRRCGEELRCTVEDNGRGFGLLEVGAGGRIVGALVSSMGGTVSATSGHSGTIVTIGMPASTSTSPVAVTGDASTSKEIADERATR